MHVTDTMHDLPVGEIHAGLTPATSDLQRAVGNANRYIPRNILVRLGFNCLEVASGDHFRSFCMRRHRKSARFDRIRPKLVPAWPMLAKCWPFWAPDLVGLAPYSSAFDQTFDGIDQYRIEVGPIRLTWNKILRPESGTCFRPLQWRKPTWQVFGFLFCVLRPSARALKVSSVYVEQLTEDLY